MSPVERIERDNCVPRLGLQIKGGEVGLHELRLWHRTSGTAHLLRGYVHTGDSETLREALRLGNSSTATEFEHSRTVVQPRDKLLLPSRRGSPTIPSRHSAKRSLMTS